VQPVFILRHADGAGPGYLAEFLALRSVPLELFRLDEGETLPATLSHASGLGIMGGPRVGSEAEEPAILKRERDLVAEACARGLPVIAHGFGAEIVCEALGGEVAADPDREIGWFPLQAAAGAVAARWSQGLPANAELFHWRDARLSLPAGAAALLQGDRGFVMDKVLALQCHLQVTPKMVTDWVARYHDALEPASARVQAEPEITRALPQRVRVLRRIAEATYGRWLEGFGDLEDQQ
jgi:GMP synthase-like glutamine amidotransferase